MSDNITPADIFTPRYTPPVCDRCFAELDEEGTCEMCGWNAFDAPEDEDDFDPNTCPDCGQEIVFGVCINSECMWRPEDDADEDGTP